MPTKVISALWASLFVTLTTSAAFGETESEPKTVPVPVLQGARAIVVAKMGEDFLKKYLSLDSARSAYYPARDNGLELTYQPSHWTVMYRVRIPSKPSFEGWVHIPVDSLGNLSNDIAWRPGVVVDSTRRASLPNPIYGGCDCLNHPEECTFAVDESTAVEAAKRAGLAEGIRPWKVRFHWVAYGPVPCYHWVIENTLHLGADSCTGGGEILFVSSSTGRVLAKHGWSSICCGGLPQIAPFPYKPR
jgi:hypothetical protein